MDIGATTFATKFDADWRHRYASHDHHAKRPSRQG